MPAMIDTLSNGPVSASSVGGATGMMIGSIVPGLGTAVGWLVGTAIGAVADTVFGARKAQQQRKQMKTAFWAAIAKRYNLQAFTSCIEQMGEAMMYAQALGFKPGTPPFDEILKKKLSTGNCIYKGNCNIELYTPGPTGPQRLAKIENGVLTPYSPNIDLDLGKKWQQACKQLHLEALKAWALELKENYEFKDSLKKETDAAKRNAATRILVNLGLSLFMLGYILKQKKKLTKIRSFKKAVKAQIASPVRTTN